MCTSAVHQQCLGSVRSRHRIKRAQPLAPPAFDGRSSTVTGLKIIVIHCRPPKVACSASHSSFETDEATASGLKWRSATAARSYV